VRYGFVIDQRKCIGCHACTVACKEENQVPLGAFRTWVKYIERGRFPDTRRYFSVLRCNHCDNAPCVRICPTVALYRRPDGIVDFDGARCIGCKSCLHACPYDALYIDPDTRTAAKCHYCAHRVEVGLEPACVIVCPAQAIIAGDLDDPRSRIARLVATEQIQVRKPEQGTRPKVFYLGADAGALTPALQGWTDRYVWGERPPEEVSLVRMVAGSAPDSRTDRALSRPVYDVPHLPRPWGGKVAAYLWTKSVAAGALLVAGLGVLLGGAGNGPLSRTVAPLLALVFLALTTGLLVFDLKRPERFLYVLTRANPGSWLVLGAWILIAYGALAGLWLGAGLAGPIGAWLAVVALALAGATAGYSALLFGQAEGRDFWQSPLLLPQLLVAAVLAGSASLILVTAVAGIETQGVDALRAALLGALALNGLVMFAELRGAHGGVDATAAARLITRGAFRRRFWAGVVAAGLVVPLALGFAGGSALPLASLLALAGLWIYEDLWVKAGQSVPLS
jgi:Fe-S-cluster-containing dehydrogenase component/formate-dependent nitrite reductase membrane component NrfD